MGIHQPRRPVSEAEIADAQKVFGDLLGKLDKASASFNDSSSGVETSAQPKAAKSSGLFGWLKSRTGPA